MRNFTARKVREFLCVQKVAGVLMRGEILKSREFLCVTLRPEKRGSSYASIMQKAASLIESGSLT